MAKILRNWSKMSVSDRITFGQKVEDNLASNPLLTLPNADYTAFTTAFDALKAKVSEVNGLEDQLKTARLARATLMDSFLGATEQMATTLEALSKGVAAALSTTGFVPTGDGVTPPPAPGELAQVHNFSVTAGDHDGELDYHHDRVQGATGYERQTASNPNDASSWVSFQQPVQQTKGTLGGFTSGSRQWVRVRALGRKSPGPWSDPATKIVP